ncbi:6-phosphogluconolactonase [Micromonospora sp. NPDC047465]|uniref:6-phosphogluconolactonase n=1 Tax=Micromonospora sp. NPDC047465 TaxID=3154813 RepID=UPI0033E22D65
MGVPAGLSADDVTLHVTADPAGAGAGAARVAADVIRGAIASRGSARIVLAAAPSQQEMLAALVRDASIDWSRVHAFHMDEYVGLPQAHPQAFGQWLQERLAVAGLGSFTRLRPEADPVTEAVRYAALLAQGPIDLTCMGIGVNGHIAFNEPDVARFDDPAAVRVVELDPVSRQQQVDEGLFARLEDVPAQAVTLTVPTLLSANSIVVTVHGRHKAAALRLALTGPIGPACPASALRTHRSVTVHADAAAASGLDELT